MTLNTTLHRWTLATLLVAVSAATFAPSAFADQGWRRYKHDGRAPWGYSQGGYNQGGYHSDWHGSDSRVVIREGYHGGSGVPLLAGLVGGMILGSVLQSHAQPVVVHDSYVGRPSDSYCAPHVIQRDSYCAPRVVEHVHCYSQPQACDRSHDDRYDDNGPQYDSQGDDVPYLDPGTVYRFEDGNGERWWDTLDECSDAARNNGGPHVIRVIEDRSNRLVVTLYWSRDHWINEQNR